MKLCRFEIGDRQHLGLVEDGGLVSLTERLPNAPSTMVDLIGHWDRFVPDVTACRGAVEYELAAVRLLAPVVPGKILATGLNYADHIAESGMKAPRRPGWFPKLPNTYCGPDDPIRRPAVSTQLDYEAELVFVVGKTVKHASAEAAEGAIFGYCAGNDVSVRDWQLRGPQIFLGKNFDTAAPIGPWIVTKDEIDPRGLDISCHVNGELRQHSNTKQLVFDCPTLLAYVSQVMTVEPGDAVFTGTPAGVGAFRDPPCWLAPGDHVSVRIEGIGTLENIVEDEQ